MNTLMQSILEKELLRSNADRYGIYRLIRSGSSPDLAFRSLREWKEHGVLPRKEMYALIYVSEPLDEAMDLDRIFEVFNLTRPKDFLCASLSVGDVIATRRGGKAAAYYVDSVGFSELPDFFEKAADANRPPENCPVCGGSLEPDEEICGRCRMLQSLLEERPTLAGVAEAFWDHCFACEAEIIASMKLTPDSLMIQCDNCGEIHTIPFRKEDLRRYLRGGIVREMVAE